MSVTLGSLRPPLRHVTGATQLNDHYSYGIIRLAGNILKAAQIAKSVTIVTLGADFLAGMGKFSLNIPPDRFDELR